MQPFLTRLGLTASNPGAAAGAFIDTKGREVASIDPAAGEVIASVRLASRADYEHVVAVAEKAFLTWRMVPAPQRGEIVRQIGEALRAHKEDLGRLVTLEVGKLLSEGKGEVQEGIDIADYAVGLSRSMAGLTLHSERANHRMYEQWHPLGLVGVITAFNFPHAVWAWNAMLGLVCGDAVVWKPSLKAPLTAIATHRICEDVLAKNGHSGVIGLVIGDDKDVGEAMIHDGRFPLISATGSTRMGKIVGKAVAERLGRSLLELGGNNAIIVNKDADMNLALRAVAFGAVGTAGQRCTSTRRLYLHDAIADDFVAKLVKAYGSIKVGNPQEDGVLCGPLIDEDAVKMYEHAIATATSQGGKVLYGGKRVGTSGTYVQPTIIACNEAIPMSREETFAPILYVFRYSDVDDAIARNNSVVQGLSSSMFTDSFRAAEAFLSARGSDCGIANINIGTSGAEIGGAFGGEKETGGGRESGSDSWKAYMRRQTCTMNWGKDLPLAQGVKFDI
jgi:aldehyde dehydrogenase (NAD+)